jgi:hypothetical protein
MKKYTRKIGLIRTLTLLTTAALAINLFAAANPGTSAMAREPARYLAQETGEFVTEKEATPEPLEESGPCSAIRNNEQISDLPLTTVSETCAETTISAGGIAIDYMPDSFSFPIKEKSDGPQDSFSNDYDGTETIDVASGPGDILSLHDYRNSGGFSVTMTASKFESSNSEMPLSNLHVATTYPDADDFDTLDARLNGTEFNGIEYSAGSNGPQDVTAAAFTSNDLNLASSYTTSFDGNNDGIADIVELMNTASSHVGRFSQALNFHLQIPASQPPGSYQVKFTVDLITT